MENKENLAYTDYPFLSTDTPNADAPIRKVTPISYDEDKYVKVEYKGKEYSFKCGYLYTEPDRLTLEYSPELYDVYKLPVTME